MTLSEFCIRRPVFATVLNLLIVAIGVMALSRVPVRELPDVDTATITIRTDYRGAAPEVIDTQITEKIEGAVAGISGIRTISSESERGDSSTRIEFETGRDIEAAANDVRDAVSRVISSLPEDAEEPRIFKNDTSGDPIIRIAVMSDRYSAAELTDYADRFVVDRLATIDGVANVEFFGERAYAMRVWLDRQALVARGLTVRDVETALRSNNLELPAGEVVSFQRQFQVRTNSRLSTAEEFRNIVLKTEGGYPIRLDDVADVEVGVESDTTLVRTEGQEAVGLGVLRQSQSNTIAIARAVAEELEAIRPGLPDGIRLEIASNDAVFIESSIREVAITLGIAIALVITVIFFFIGSLRATLVPAVTIPVALTGSFIGLYAAGFSINILTLFALILAIGIVVDDAIVVLENIQRRIEEGQKPLIAAIEGSKEVTFAVIATSLTLVAVFVPISFLEGQVGRLFTEFGIILAIAVLFSTFVALTLCPVLCSRLLKGGERSFIERGVEKVFGLLNRGYRRFLVAALGMPLVVVSVAFAIGGSAYWFYNQVPQELSPKEDRGVFFIIVNAPRGSTVDYTDVEVREIEQAVQPLLDNGTAQRVFSVVGFRGEERRAFVVVRLKPWDQREISSQSIVQSLIPPVVSVPGARAFPIQPSGLGLRGSSSPLRVVVGGPDFESVQQWSQQLREKLEANENLQNVDSNYEETQPQILLDINRPLADDLGIRVETISSTLQTLFASREITTYVDRGREYPVIVQARDEDRRTEQDLTNVFVRSDTSGELIPLSAVVETRETTASPEINRYNRLLAIEITAALADGYDLGSAIEFVNQAASEVLPPEAQLSFAGQSKEFLETSGGVFLVFVFAIIIIYLVLAAQFESFLDPLVILLSVPLSVTGALATLWLTGLSLNIYTQIGLILLVGLMAKNGILIVEFANQLRDRGMDVREAIEEAAVLRLRPIVMTVLSTLLGAVPLAFASGAGAESRMAIGFVIIGGFGVASLLTLFLTPVLYNLVAPFAKSRAAVSKEIADMERGEQIRQPAE
jgi:multidrug efflux pump